MDDRECTVCGETYKPKAKNQKYCSTICRQTPSKENDDTRSCLNETCDNQFACKKSDPKKYCSSSCAASVNNKLSPKRQPEGKCEVCKTPISNSRKFCGEHSPISGNGLVYEQVPVLKICKYDNCKKEFYTIYAIKLFCNRKCSSKYHQESSRKDIDRKLSCPLCAGPKAAKAITCKYCEPIRKRDSKIASWVSGEWFGGSENLLSKTIRKYLLEEANYACSKCGFDKMHPDDGRTVLEINHIDGNGGNHRPENLEVLCPNCHSLTPNYRGRNQGNGRKVYYYRVPQ